MSKWNRRLGIFQEVWQIFLEGETSCCW